MGRMAELKELLEILPDLDSEKEKPKEIPGLISFRTDWLDLLAVQGTLKSLLQHLDQGILAPPDAL